MFNISNPTKIACSAITLGFCLALLAPASAQDNHRAHDGATHTEHQDSGARNDDQTGDDHESMDHEGMDHEGMDHGDHDHSADADDTPADASPLPATTTATAPSLTHTPEIDAALAAGGEPVVLEILGVVCDFCAKSLNKTFGRRDEVAANYVDLDRKTLCIVFKPGATIDDEALTTLVKKAGYKIASIRRGADALIAATPGEASHDAH